MKVWFFRERWKSSRGWKTSYEAVIAHDCHMTFGRNFADTIFMAYDLVACVKNDTPKKIYDEPFDELNDGIFDEDSRNLYVGSMEIDVDLFMGNGWLCAWRRKGDKAPNTKQFMRVRMLQRAFQLVYKNFKLDA